MSAWIATQAFDEIALKWRALVERRRAHLVELYQSGRWKLYYSEERFLLQMRGAVRQAERWAELAPLPGEETLPEPAETPPQRDAA